MNLVIALLAGSCVGVLAFVFLGQHSRDIDRFTGAYTKRTVERFSDLFLFVDVRRFVLLFGLLLVVIPLGAWLVTDDFLAAVPIFLLLLMAPHFLLKLLWKRRITEFEHQLPDGLLAIAGSLRAGSSLEQAVESLARESDPPLSQEFNLFLRQRRLGVESDEALETMEKRIGLEDFSLVVAAVRVSREIGGNLADTLENLSESLREKLVMEGRIRTLTAQGRLQGLVMSVLPLFLIGVLLKLEPDTMSLLFTTRLGWMVLGLVGVMQVLGFLSIRKITNIEV